MREQKPMAVVLFALGYEKRSEGVDGRRNRPVKARLYNRVLSTELGPPDGPAYLNRAVHVPSPLFRLFRVWTTAVFPLPFVCQKGIKVLVGISGPLLVAVVRVVGFSFKRLRRPHRVPLWSSFFPPLHPHYSFARPILTSYALSSRADIRYHPYKKTNSVIPTTKQLPSTCVSPSSSSAPLPLSSAPRLPLLLRLLPRPILWIPPSPPPSLVSTSVRLVTLTASPSVSK